jgi:beta-ureidopropionase / N-carbamoyl-L-amino-acid hydrolase
MNATLEQSPSTAATDFGARVLALADRLAAWSETGDGLTCTYLSAAHRAVAQELACWMEEAGMTSSIDAVGNVVGRYPTKGAGAKTLGAKTLILGSHYDTVRNAGKYDGRLGILVPLVVVASQHRGGLRFPFNLELIAFAEEEGVRFGSAYIGSSAVAGCFDPQLLQRRDPAGVSLAEALREAGQDPDAISRLARRRRDLLGYLELHIEQGPVLRAEGIPVGVVTSIAGASRYALTVTGVAGHAGTVPMYLRHDAAAAAAEMILLVERRCAQDPDLVGTIGQIMVADAASNVIPGRCELSLDIRSGQDKVREAATSDILLELERIAARRGVAIDVQEISRVPAVTCAPSMQARLARAVEHLGLPVRRLASGAGHDAVMLSTLTEIGMLFVRCGNGGISHSPLETVTAEDVDVAARVLLDVLVNFEPAP